MRQAVLGFIAGVIVTLLVVGPVQAGIGNCGARGKCPVASPAVTPRATSPVPTSTNLVVPTPTTSSAYTFVDEFNGTSLDPVWIRHYSCCGTLAGYDPALATESGGYLHIRAERRSAGWFSYLLDTKTTWRQQYGVFEARIRIPKGKGLWPAFWGYNDADSAEIDTMEVCANPIGANGGNDASLLHTHVHWSGGGDAGRATRTVDLSAGFHVYAHEWRSDHVAFYLDGAEVWRFTDATHVPKVSLPLILNLGVGGSWCGAPDSTTPSPATMQVDWVRVSP